VKRLATALWIAGWACCALFAGHILFGLGGEPWHFRFDMVYGGAFAAAGALCIIGGLKDRGERVPWLLMGAGIVSFGVGNFTTAVVEHRGHVMPFPSIADAFWLGFYAAAFVALILLMRGRIRLVRSGLWADALIGVLAVAAFGAAVLIKPILASTDGVPSAVVTNLAYPLMDVLILGVVLCAFAVTEWRPGRSWWILGGAFAGMAIADTIYLYEAASGFWSSEDTVNLAWPVLALTLAAASFQARPARREMRAEGGWAQLVIPTGFVTLGLALTAYGTFFELHPAAGALAVATLLAGLVRAVTAYAGARRLTQASLERTTQILNSAGEGIVGVDADLRVVFANRATEQLLGYSADELVGHLGTDFTTLLDPGAETARRKDGTSFPFEYTFTAAAQGGGTGVVVFRDISERHEVDRMKDEFTSIVSHELRTPLTSIRGSLGLLASGVLGPLEDKGQRMVEIAVENTDRLVRLINNMLDIERMQAGRLTIVKEPCDAGGLIRTAVDTMRPMAEAAGVELAVETGPGIALQVDPDRLIQTMTNLLSNAIKYSNLGTVVSTVAERVGDDVRIRVSDQGRGIPPDKLTAVFGRFEQIDASDSREKGGTGLGLAICAGIVEQHGGRIWAESPPGEGATFTVSLPADRLPRPPTAILPTPERGELPLVLMCDDDPSILAVVSTILEHHGYRVTCAQSGRQALELAAAEPPDVILLDLLMPGMDGWETAAALRHQQGTEDVPVVILSVLVQSETEPVVADVVGWLEKPLHEQSLLDALDRAIHRGDHPSHVLVVEDDRNLAHVLCTAFERHGIETQHALSGLEAIELAQQEEPDLIVLDLGLPGCDGFTVVEWLRRHESLRNTSVLVYSARELDAEQRDRLRLGEQTEYLVKGRATPALVEQRVLYLLRSLTQEREAVVLAG
jgi:PAS domain S-box-containing protein